MADLLDRIRGELDVRLGELRPLVGEHDRLEAALRVLGEPDRTSRSAPRSAPAKRSAAASAAGPPPAPKPSPAKRRKHAAHGANRRAVLHTVSERPGASAGEIAAVSGVERSSLYALLARLVQTGELVKRDLPTGQAGYAPADQDATALA
jgi:hypothetical protein